MAAKLNKYAYPRVGVGLFLINPSGKFLMGKRIGSVGANTWGLPGGHLDLHESFETCATRELKEETGLSIPESSVKFLTAINLPDKNGKSMNGRHYISIFMGARVGRDIGEARVMEPASCERWEWLTWDEAKHSCEAMVKIRKELQDPFAKVTDGEGRNMFEGFIELLSQRPGFDLQKSMDEQRLP